MLSWTPEWMSAPSRLFENKGGSAGDWVYFPFTEREMIMSN